MNTVAHNIYIHVPFCMSKCNYCAFFSRACIAPDWEQYTRDICDEVVFWANKLGRPDVPTIFFGGGTPSLMPVQCFDKIMHTIHQNFNTSACCEVTLESNPKTLDRQKLADFRHAGMSRLSVGVQSLNDKKLKFLGRRHTVADALQLLDVAHSMNINVSADFIYGMPDDTVRDVIDLCCQINKLGLTHCSMYELTIEQNSVFGKMNLNMPSNEEMAQMYLAIPKYLNLPRYEVSNYATQGYQCMHNKNIWDGDAYVGIGLGGAGRVNIDGVWYEQMGAHKRFEKMSSDARAVEKIITGMRTIRGCRLTDDVKNAIDMHWIEQNPDLVQVSDNRVMATGSGMLILDDILINLVK